jgi:hypothetical protein
VFSVGSKLSDVQLLLTTGARVRFRMSANGEALGNVFDCCRNTPRIDAWVWLKMTLHKLRCLHPKPASQFSSSIKNPDTRAAGVHTKASSERPMASNRAFSAARRAEAREPYASETVLEEGRT